MITEHIYRRLSRDWSTLFASEPLSQLPPVPTDTAKSWHVLIAEDESAIAELISDALSEAGFRVTLAADGAAALLECSRTKFDVLLTDVRMPNVDGVSLVRQLRQSRPDMPIVVLSGYMTGEDYRALRRLGIPASSMLEKPIPFTQLSNVLQAALAA